MAVHIYTSTCGINKRTDRQTYNKHLDASDFSWLIHVFYNSDIYLYIEQSAFETPMMMEK